MGVRCERCKTSELASVSFGVFDCPVCGRVDADGNLLGTSRGADDTGPQTFETPGGAFATPPPAGAATPVIAAAPGSRDMPGIFLATLGVSALLDIGAAIVSRNVLGLVFRVVFYGSLLTGKPWARALSMVLALLTMALCVLVALALPGAPTVLRVLMTVLVLVNAWWLYVLLRPDTVAYFTR